MYSMLHLSWGIWLLSPHWMERIDAFDSHICAYVKDFYYVDKNILVNITGKFVIYLSLVFVPFT